MSGREIKMVMTTQQILLALLVGIPGVAVFGIVLCFVGEAVAKMVWKAFH